MRTLTTTMLVLLLAGCGQKGPLYLPDQAREVVTHPSPAPAPAPSPAETSGAQNSPQTVDSPEGPASPAPEVVVPGSDKDRKGKATPPPK
jgi:predicted small lipoprotein YifL